MPMLRGVEVWIESDSNIAAISLARLLNGMTGFIKIRMASALYAIGKKLTQSLKVGSLAGWLSTMTTQKDMFAAYCVSVATRLLTSLNLTGWNGQKLLYST
jgi:hypothetical protein